MSTSEHHWQVTITPEKLDRFCNAIRKKDGWVFKILDADSGARIGKEMDGRSWIIFATLRKIRLIVLPVLS